MLLREERPVVGPLTAQARVIWAIILRDIRTRFFGHGLGYLVAIAWPLAHILILLIVYQFIGRTAPYGTSLSLFFATGLAPFMSFSYMSRFISMSLMMNRPLLQLPAVKVTDLVLGRAILELLASCCMVLLLLGILYVIGVDVVPVDIVQAYAAFGSALLLGLGFGVVNAILAIAIPGWYLAWVLILIILYLSSGILFVADSMPAGLRYLASFNPAFHAVEWMRMAYFEGYTASALDKGYILAWGCGTLFAGLLVERLIRGRLLQG